MALLLRPSLPSQHLGLLLSTAPAPSRLLPAPSPSARLLFKHRVVAAAVPQGNAVAARAFMASTAASEAMQEKRVAGEYTAANVQVYEILDNAVDEGQAGYATEINVVLHDDNSVSITDNGRGAHCRNAKPRLSSPAPAQFPLRGSAMATAKPMAPVPLARILPLHPTRRWRADSTRALPPSITCSADAGGELPARLQPNAWRPLWHGGGFSLGVDLGAARTGIAVGRGITQPRPLTVLKLRGQKLELMLLDVAKQQEADELIIGLPVSADGRETPQSNKVRSVVGRLAVQAADRGLRVYLQDEHGTSIDALDYMISRGVKRSARDVKCDAYAAVMILERYFSSSGQGAQIVLPRQQELQDKLILKSRKDVEV